MAEFKKLSEVEQIESVSDNATVLVEDGGEIKRVSKSAVGGAGGYVIKLSESYINYDSLYTINENYDELYDVLMAGGSVWIDYVDAPENAAPTALAAAGAPGLFDVTNFGPEKTTAVQWIITDVGLFLFDINSMLNGGRPAVHFPNGSHNLEPGDR